MLYLIKLNLLLAAGYLFYRIIFQSGTTLNARRYFLLFVVLFAATIPCIQNWNINAVQSDIPVLQSIQVGADNLQNSVVQQTNSTKPIALIYLIIAGVMFVISILKIAKLVRLLRISGKEKTGNYYLICNEQIPAPASFFNYIFMPANLDVKSNALILIHEKIHAAQWHSIDVLITEVVKCVCWFNPFVYLLQRDLRFVHECIADHEAGKAHQTIYQELLLRFHLSTSINILTNHFNQTSNLKRRITMFNSSFSTKKSFLKLALVLPFFIVAGILQTGAQNQIVSSVVVTESEVQPEFPGGMDALIKYLSENIKYPEAAKSDNIQGTTYIEFTVSKSGKIKNVTVKKGSNDLLDAEAVRVVKSMPDWTPGTKEGKKADFVQVLPIRFALN
ncbi:MAG: M56 family metallopeptidase [Chitinophagales bacterium]